MPMEKLSVRKVMEILRLKYEIKLTHRQIAQSVKASAGTVGYYVGLSQAAGLSWPLPLGMTEEGLLAALNLKPSSLSVRPQPDLQQVHQELKHKGVTLFLLWQEYKALQPDGYGYSRFCEAYRRFADTLQPVMRQVHKAGEKLFVDYAGMTIPLVNAATGEIQEAQIFVAVLGASNYTYVEATLSQALPDWIMSHVRAFHYFDGVPQIVVPDNLKSAVTKAHHYDPDINLTYQEMANHYGVAVVPARARKPQDKAKVEVGVQGIERHILAPLRHQTFFHLAEVNAAIIPLLKRYNERPFQQLPGSRRSSFESLERPALKSLPTQPYCYAQWKKVRAGIDYHIAFEGHYYSVPYRYIKHELDLRITTTTVECFYKGKVIALHVRAYQAGRFTTLTQHMPKAHQEYAQWTPERLHHWAAKTGPATAALMVAVIEARVQPQQAFRACLGILRLGKSFGDARLEKACERALKIGATTYKSIESILRNGLDQQPLPQDTASPAVTTAPHSNIRGADYYH